MLNKFKSLPLFLLEINDVQYTDDGVYMLSCFHPITGMPCAEAGYFRVRVVTPIKQLTNLDNLADSINKEIDQDVGQNAWLEWVQIPR